MPADAADPVAASRQPTAERRALWASPSLAYLPGLPLLIILTVEAGLSLRLIRSNTAFTDEALYLWAGHLEWAHWLHGASLPDLPSYFSGAPVIYPPLAALADSIGGLAGARLLSLCFMLGATGLLYGAAARLYGRLAGFLAAAIWAVAGPTLKLGAYATFDPMSIFLMALAVWCVIRAGNRSDGTIWIAGAAGALALANAAAYSSAIFDPVVIAIALLSSWPAIGARLAAMRAALLSAYTIATLIAFVTLAGSGYATGIGATVLNRAGGGSRAGQVVRDTVSWTWPVAVAVTIAVALAFAAERSRSRRAMVLVLAAAVLLVPVEQLRLHTTTSLDKHVDFGMWLAAVGLGYAVGRLCQLRRARIFRVLALSGCVLAIVPLAPAGLAQAQTLFSWPNSAAFVAAFRPLAEHSSGPLLVEAPSPARYYLGTSVRWQRWSSTWSVTLPDGHSVGQDPGVTAAGQPQVYARLIARGYFTLIALNSTTTPVLDQQIVSEMVASHRYRLIKTVPYPATYYGGYYSIWQRT